MRLISYFQGQIQSFVEYPHDRKKKTFTFGMKRNTCLFALYVGAPIPRDIKDGAYYLIFEKCMVTPNFLFGFQ